ncbi:ABC transporter-like protein [Geopyxis carbonaria]|nr:ABC transporter-like protein [Geopyxis carbonaria]
MSTFPESNQTPAAPGSTVVPAAPAVLEHQHGQPVQRGHSIDIASYLSLYRPLRSFKERAILAAAIVLALAAGAPLPIIGVIFGKIINAFPPSEDELRVRIGQLLGVAVAYFFITWGWATCWGMVGEVVSRGLREELLKKAVGMDMAWFEVECPDIANRLTADTQAIQLGTSEKVGLFLQSIAYFIAAFTAGFVLNARLTGILFAGVVPAMFVVVTFGSKYVSRYAKEAQAHSEQATAVAEGAINAVQVVQAFGALERLADEHMAFMKPAVRKGVLKSISGAAMLGLVFFLAYAANALAFWEGSRQIAAGLFAGGEGAGTVYTVVFLILDASFVIGQFGPFLQTFAVAAAAGDKILALLDRPAPTIDVYSTEGLAMPQPVEANDLVLHDVSFAYPARAAVRVLDAVTLVIPAGKATAIVGPSGSGKSTIASLLLRFYDPASGRVTVGAHDLRALNVRSYRSNVALVDQHPALFSGTVLENIAHGLLHTPGLSADEIRARCIQAARDANAHDFIAALPQGFDTVLGGGGGTALSGGQKARVALARALVADPAILVLDEPTAALDTHSEALVLEALERAKARRGRTTVMIAHRLATVRGADKIVVMADGKVAEEGTHEDLIAREGAYFRLVKAQKLDSGSSASSLNSATTKFDAAIAPERVDDEKAAAKPAPADEEAAVQTNTYTSSTLIRRALSLSAPDRGLIALGLCASFITGGLILGEAIVFGNLVSVLNTRGDPDKMRTDAAFYALMFFIISCIALVAYTTSGTAFGIVSERLIRRIRDRSLRTILRQDLAWFSQPGRSPAALVGMLNMDSGHLSGLSGVILGTIVSVLTSMLGGIVLAHVVAWKIAIVLLAAVPVMLVSGFLRLRILAKFEQRHETAYLDAAALATEACRAIRTVAALGREHDVTRLYRAAVEKPYQESLGFIVVGNFWLAFALAITYFVYALAYYWGSRQVREGGYTSLDFFIVLPALLFSAQASGQMFSLAPEVTRAKSAARSIFNLHDQRPSIDTTPHAAPSAASPKTSSAPSASSPSSLTTTTTTTTPATLRGKIEFRAVSFSYPSRPTVPVLHDLSFTIAPGSFIALVGASGAGKSSTISLLERFYDPTAGTILLNDVPIASLPVRSHRARISLVSQDPCLFPGSIAFNIALGAAPDAATPTPAEVEAAARQVGLHDFIVSLPMGYQTPVGADGGLLSGGQRQRIALARALVRDPDVLLLDEATSALDSISERLVQESVAAARRGRTCVAVAHRLSSVVRADWIWVFEQGRIVEGGRHEELLRRGGVYARMVGGQDLG